MEYCSGVWGPSLTRAQTRLLQRVQSDVLRAALRVPARTPVVVLHLETGVQYLKTRWEMLLFRFLSKMLSAGEDRISRNALISAVRNSIPWALAIIRTLRSCANEELPALRDRCTVDDLSHFLSAGVISPIRVANSLMEREAKSMHSLSLYSDLRSWRNISKKYAWSGSSVGKPACCLHEAYLDSWSSDHFGVRLKLLARCNSIRSMEDCCAVAHTRNMRVQHLFFHCNSLRYARDCRDHRLATAFRSISRMENGLCWADYSSLDVYQKLLICLGKQTGNPILDKKIDVITRLFLRQSYSILKFRERSSSS